MEFYKIALFLHVIGALGLFVALGLEWTAMAGLRSAATAEEARRSLGGYRILRALGPISLAVILVAGLYMTAASVGWLGWNTVALGGVVLIFALGAGSNATRLPRIGRALGPRQGPLPQEIKSQLSDRILWSSMLTRTAIAVGIVFLMTVRPDLAGSALVIGVSAAVGLVAAALSSRRPTAGTSARTGGLERAS